MDFEDIQLWEDEEFLTDILKDFINIDGSEDDMKDNGFSNKPLNEGFYLILPLSVYNYLDHMDFFIFIRFEKMGKEAIVIITAILITVETPLAATAEIAATLETRSDQISPSKGAGNISSFKVRFYNNVIVIKESSDIDIIALNDKAAMSGVTTLEVL